MYVIEADHWKYTLKASLMGVRNTNYCLWGSSFPGTQIPKIKTNEHFQDSGEERSPMLLPVELEVIAMLPLSFCFILPHFSGLHTLSTVLLHVHKGHLADTPWFCDPYVLVAVTVAWDDLIHLKHTSGDLRLCNESRGWVDGRHLYCHSHYFIHLF